MTVMTRRSGAFTPEGQVKVKAWWSRAAAIAAEQGAVAGEWEAWPGANGYDGEPVVKLFAGDSTRGTVVKPENKSDGLRRADNHHPRRAEVMEWLAATDLRWSDFLTSLKGQAAQRPLSVKQLDAAASAMDKLNARQAERTQQQATRPAPVKRIEQDGMYKVGDIIYKVQVAVHGSGQLYAKRLEVLAHGTAQWVYAPGVVKTLTEADRLTLDEAVKFGQLYGVCAQCGRTLTDEASIARGIGPVCAGKL